MLRNLTFVICTICSLQILTSDQDKFLLFSSNFWATLVIYKKPLLFFGQRFDKLRETFWKISSNLWKALAEVPKYPLFLAERRPTYVTPPSVTQKLSSIGCTINYTTATFCSALSATRLSQGHVHFILFFFPFLSFPFFNGQFSYRLSRLCPDKLWAWCDVDPHHLHIHGPDLIGKSVYT